MWVCRFQRNRGASFSHSLLQVWLGLTPKLKSAGGEPSERLKLHHAPQTVGMDEAPSQALRAKRNSSMRIALNLVKEGQAQACVSAGNSGALMAMARYVLKTLPGIDRPAMISALPSKKGQTHVLDLGANIDLTADQLFQLAVMGSVIARAIHNIPKPSVGVLNIGEEEIKGNETVKEAARLLAASHLNDYGFVEGDDIYKGTVDVVVCDGFVGNVALKSSEGVANMLISSLKEAFTANLFTKLIGLLVKPVLSSFRTKFDPRHYNGATLVGLRGVVIKSHGGADALAFENAINVAVIEARQDVPSLISEELRSVLVERQAG